MKKKLTSLTALFIFALGCSPRSWVSSQDRKRESRATSADAETARRAQAMRGLRDKLLTSSQADIGLEGKDAEAKVWGVMMEAALPSGIVTIMSLRDGTASLYMSTGFGILGGYSARVEAKRFVVEGEKHLAIMKPAKSFPYPEGGRFKFYVLTRDGVYTAEADEKEILGERHALSPLFVAGNEVLTVLRIASGRAKPDD